MSKEKDTIELAWDVGTAHDMFMSLDALHHPETLGLRGAWAAGVRSRLPAPERDLLQQVHTIFFKGPLYWVYQLPAPKDGTTALHHMGQIPPEERLHKLIYYPNMPPQLQETLELVEMRQSWGDEELNIIREAYQQESVSRKDAASFLDLWTQSHSLGEQYLAALSAYYEVFFAEEEQRIGPALESAVERVNHLAKELDVLSLLEEISEGFRFGEALQVSKLILIPSFWVTPLVCYFQITPDCMLFMFGARPADASLVPGEVVPDSLFNALKALADPTRLRILRYLMTEPLTPTELAQRLRLRAPTVVHHLRTLRLAGLVQLTLASGKKVHYTARAEAVNTMVTALKDFLAKDISPF